MKFEVEWADYGCASDVCAEFLGLRFMVRIVNGAPRQRPTYRKLVRAKLRLKALLRARDKRMKHSRLR